jgi:biopolymer transport protein ExbD
MASKARPNFPEDEDVDLNPLIDVITMLIIFFLLGGKMTADVRTEQITVPPTKTASKIENEKGWERTVINVWGNTQVMKGTPYLHIRVETKDMESTGTDDYTAYIKLRQLLDKLYDRDTKDPDPKGSGIQIPRRVLEIRADADTQYRIIQEIQQVVTDTINPEDGMKPKNIAPAQMRPFVNINFTSRLPGRDQPAD